MDSTDSPQSIAVAPAPVYLTAPLPNLAAWIQFFTKADIPVLESTAVAFEELRAREDDVDAGMLAALVEDDPFMTIKLLACVSGLRRKEGSTQTETVISSLVLMGVSPFFRHFGLQPTVEQQLGEHPAALDALAALLKRAKRAAHFATGFAVHRGDTDVAVIRQAAFLNDFAEMLMFCYAPTMCLEVQSMQQANPSLRTASLQRFVFNTDLGDVRQELMKQWHFPELLVRISDGKHAQHPSVLNVLLAARLARHTEHGWDNPALPDDIEDIAQLLNATPRVTRGFVYKIDQPA